MKYLIKNRHAHLVEADAARLQDCKLDPNAAMNAIQSIAQDFAPEKLVKDSAAGTSAYWGAISDDATMACECYIYKGAQDAMKAAFVAAPVDNLSQMVATVRAVEKASEIRGMVHSGITFQSGSKLIFVNEYTTLQTAQDAQPKTEEAPADGQQQVASKK